MERFLVTGGNRLVGEVAVGGAKNSVLKLMAAALLAEGTTTITNCPDILDVPLMGDVLRGLGCDVAIDGSVVTINTPAEPKYHADFPAVTQFRASVCVLGPLMARCKRAVVALPGGDAIGSRPLDMHQASTRRDQRNRARLCGRARGRTAGRADPAGFSFGGRDREHPHGGRAGRGGDGHR
jgi:UDP-N-acetylglucosamine 1-carboxyvinyltransferase